MVNEVLFVLKEGTIASDLTFLILLKMEEAIKFVIRFVNLYFDDEYKMTFETLICFAFAHFRNVGF